MTTDLRSPPSLQHRDVAQIPFLGRSFHCQEWIGLCASASKLAVQEKAGAVAGKESYDRSVVRCRIAACKTEGKPTLAKTRKISEEVPASLEGWRVESVNETSECSGSRRHQWSIAEATAS